MEHEKMGVEAFTEIFRRVLSGNNFHFIGNWFPTKDFGFRLGALSDNIE